MRVHRVRCECGADVPATAGQAGAAKDCPRCGKKVDIPPLRDLRLLPVLEAVGGKRGWGWGFPASLAMAGIAIALVAWITAAVLFSRSMPRGGSVVSDPAAIARSFESAPLPEVYDMWWSLGRVGVDRGQTEEETVANRIVRGRLGVAYALLLFGGLGGILAIAGLILAAIRTPSP